MRKHDEETKEFVPFNWEVPSASPTQESASATRLAHAYLSGGILTMVKLERVNCMCKSICMHPDLFLQTLKPGRHIQYQHLVIRTFGPHSLMCIVTLVPFLLDKWRNLLLQPTKHQSLRDKKFYLSHKILENHHKHILSLGFHSVVCFLDSMLRKPTWKSCPTIWKVEPLRSNISNSCRIKEEDPTICNFLQDPSGDAKASFWKIDTTQRSMR